MRGNLLQLEIIFFSISICGGMTDKEIVGGL